MSEVIIKVRTHGPLLVQGPVKIVDPQGNVFAPPNDKPNVALCRCGQSKIRPFCDGSHIPCGFQADDSAARDSDI